MVFSEILLGIPYGDGIYDWGIATDRADLLMFAELPTEQLTRLNAPGIDAIALLGGDDTVICDSGNRIYFGNRGNDDIRGFGGSDTISSGRDNDTLNGGPGNDFLFGNLGNDFLFGGSDDDRAFGGQDDDWVIGDFGNDHLYGDFGRDTLYGNIGIDTLTGGAMEQERDGLPDTFVLYPGERDVITGFEDGIDRIFLPNGVSTDEIEVRDDPEGGTLLISRQTGEPLAFLLDTPPTAIDPEDFVKTQSGTINLARDLGLVDDPIPVGEGVWFLGAGIPPEELRIDRPNNVNAADTTNTIALQLPPLQIVEGETSLGLDLHGSGLTIGVWEATETNPGVWRIRDTHQELTGRVNFVDDGIGFSNHATHVAGTIAASGIDPKARGMADLVNIRSYSSDNDVAELDRDASWMVASNHSYGQSSGWTIGDEEPVNTGLVRNTDVWLQDYSISATEDVDFGKYSSEARDLDEVLFANPHLLSVWSAGNDRDDGFSNRSGNNTYVTYFGSDPNVTGFNWIEAGWYRVPIDTIAPPDLDGNGNTGYDALSVQQTAKNHLVVGAIDDMTNDPYTSANVSMSGFSSWGPTDDGRIKPDVVANGVGVFSATAHDARGNISDNSYRWMNGTSMAAPNVTGTAALLIEHYNNLFDPQPRSATTKALLVHTAFDAGRTGPDYQYGWGVVDATAAAEFLTYASNPSPDSVAWLLESTYQGNPWTANVQSFSGPLTATLVWTDPPGEAHGNGLDDNTPVLVNDLDLWVSGPDGRTYYPWTLDPDRPDMTASRDRANHLDNVEQVVIDPPLAGDYTLHIGHTGDVYWQDYSLLVSGVRQIHGSDLVVRSVDAIGSPFLRDNDIILPIEVTVANQGDQTANEVFKVSAHYEPTPGSGGSYLLPFDAQTTSDVDGSDLWYPFTLNPLDPGDEVTFTGELTLIDETLRDREVSVWAVADSTASEEFAPSYGRVQESRENNNISEPLDVRLTLP